MFPYRFCPLLFVVNLRLGTIAMSSHRQTGEFDTEMTYFVRNQDALVRRYDGRTLVIRGTKIEGVYDSHLEAYLAAKARFAPGSFMIQRCEPGRQAYTVTVSSINLTERADDGIS